MKAEFANTVTSDSKTGDLQRLGANISEQTKFLKCLLKRNEEDEGKTEKKQDQEHTSTLADGLEIA